MRGFRIENRIVAALLCLVLVGGVAVGIVLRGSDVAKASGTLSGITQLKSSGGEYVILEIVPDVSQSAFAWYVGGSEPVSNRKLSVAYSGDLTGYEISYRSTTAMLEYQGYLLTSDVEADGSESILNNLGEISVVGSGMDGGFENNEWFLRYVLGWNEDELMPNVRVMSVTPEAMTTVHLDMADLVILSGGYYYPDSNTSPEVYSLDASKNLSSSVTDALISRVSGVGSTGNMGLALILDRRAYNVEGDSSLNSNRVFHEILKNDPRNVASGVYGSVFYYSSVDSEFGNAITLEDGSRLGSSSGTSMGYLVTPEFHTPFNSSMASGNFKVVMDSIQSENALRGGVDLISEEISMASVVQYLVGGRDMTSTVSVSDKTSVKILSLQPGNTSGVAVYSAGNHDKYGMGAPTFTVKVSLPVNVNDPVQGDQVSWEQLERWTGVSRNNITVVEMSIQEFVNSSDPISGVYDMVYIGNDISGFEYGVYSETAQFTSSSQSLANPNSYTYFAPSTGDLKTPMTTYTAVSTDLSLVRYQELMEYVSAGRPVILAPYLCAGLNWLTDWIVPSSSAIDKDSYMYALLSNASGRSNVMRQDMLIAGPDGVEGTDDDDTMLTTCLNGVHIPTPTIVMKTLSTSMMDGAQLEPVYSASGTAEYKLEYVFQITNDTVSASSGVTYKLNLMLDLNLDGIYETDCRLYDDLLVEQLETALDGSLVLDSTMNPIREAEVGLTSLRQDQYYRVSVTLPDSVSGYIPWQLSVEASDTGVVSYSTSAVSTMDGATSISLLHIDSDNSSFYSFDGQGDLFAPIDFDYKKEVYSNVDGNYNLSGYNVILIGFDSYMSTIGEESLSTLKTALGNFDGAIIVANSGLTLSTQDDNDDELTYLVDHPLWDLSGGSTSATSVSVSSYPNADYNLDGDTFFVMQDNVFFTNQSLASGEGIGSAPYIFANTLSSALGITEVPEVEEDDNDFVELPTYADLLVYRYAQPTGQLGADSVLSITENNVENGDEVPVYFTMKVNTNSFTVGAKIYSAEETLMYDSNVSLQDNPLASMGGVIYQIGAENNDTYTTGATVVMKTESDGVELSNSSESVFSLVIPSAMISQLASGTDYLFEIYLENLNKVEFASAMFTITVDTFVDNSWNKVQGSDFYYLGYVEDVNGDYIKEGDKFILAANTSLGQFYVKNNSEKYYVYDSSEYRPATHYMAWNGSEYLELPITDETHLEYEAKGWNKHYVLSMYELDDNGGYYYNLETGTYELVPDNSGVQYYSKETNMNDFTLFQIG